MKPVTYFRFALLLPYLLWGLSALVIAVAPQETSPTWTTLLMPVYFYAFGVLVWFIPYTVLAIGMWVWSRDKSATSLFKAAMISPLVLVVFMVIETALVSLPSQSMSEFGSAFPGQILVLGGFSLVFGYVCVGIALGIYRLLQTRRIIAQEPSAEPQGN